MHEIDYLIINLSVSLNFLTVHSGVKCLFYRKIKWHHQAIISCQCTILPPVSQQNNKL